MSKESPNCSRGRIPLLVRLNFTATWLRRYSGAGSVKRWTRGEYSVHFGCGIEALKTAPESLRSRRSIALASQVATHSAHHPSRTVERRRLLGREWAFGGVTTEGLPFFVCEIHGAGQVGRFAGQHHFMKNAPGANQIYTKAGLQAVCGAQLTVFDAATALERAMEDLDSPTPGVPSHTLLGVLEAARLDCGEQHPFNGVLIRRVLGLFTYIHGPRWNGRAVLQTLGRFQVE